VPQIVGMMTLCIHYNSGFYKWRRSITMARVEVVVLLFGHQFARPDRNVMRWRAAGSSYVA
jgi:hypothetical protein